MAQQRLRYRNEYREALTRSVKRIKNTVLIEQLYKLSELYRKSWDNNECKEITEGDRYKVYVINAALSDTDVNWKMIHSFIRGISNTNRRERDAC